MKTFVVTAVLTFFICRATSTATEAPTHLASDPTGAICLGPDLSKAYPASDIFVSIKGVGKKLFSGSSETIAFDKLDINKEHTVDLIQGTKKFDSIRIDFKKSKTNFVVLWKAAGAWKVIPVGGEKCTWPVPRCPKGTNCS